MSLLLLSRSPSDFVAFLRQPGLATRRGPVPLDEYVSTGSDHLRAREVMAAFDRLLATRGPESELQVDLRRARDLILADGGRDSSWRRAFTGQGAPAHLQCLFEVVLRHPEAVRSLLAAGPGAGAVGSHPVAAVVGNGNTCIAEPKVGLRAGSRAAHGDPEPTSTVPIPPP